MNQSKSYFYDKSAWFLDFDNEIGVLSFDTDGKPVVFTKEQTRQLFESMLIFYESHQEVIK